MNSKCSNENSASDAETFNIHFEYRPGTYVLKDDMRIFIEEKRFSLKKDESKDIEVPSGVHHVAFKSSILGTNLDIDVTKDMTVILGWDSVSGKISVKVN